MSEKPSQEVRKALLLATRDCLRSARLLADVRPIAREWVEIYEPCIDQSLAQALELLSGLLYEYQRRGDEESEFVDLGDEPQTPAEALRELIPLLERFATLVERALSESSFVLPAVAMAVRTFTFSCLLRERSVR